MRNYLHLFQRKNVIANEQTALLQNPLNTTIVSVPEKKHAKKNFTLLADNHIDEIIFNFFVASISDICIFRLLSKPLFKIAQAHTPFSLYIIKKIFLDHETNLIVRDGFKTATIPVFLEITSKKIKHVKEIDIMLINKLKEIEKNLHFKTRPFDYFPSGFNQTLTIIFLFLTLILLIYFLTPNVGLYKSYSDMFFCNTLTSYWLNMSISQSAIDNTMSWIQRNHPLINTTNGIIAFCDLAQRKYCANFFRASKNKNGIFDSQLGANVICRNAATFLLATGLFFALTIFIISTRLCYVFKKWPTLREKKALSELGPDNAYTL